MEQLNKVLPDAQGEKHLALVETQVEKKGSPMLLKMRSNFGFFGGISMIFGTFFALLFYKAGTGINVFLYTLLLVSLLILISKKLSATVKTGTKYYYAGAILLALSSTLTSSYVLQFLNIIGILLLLDLSLLHQFYEDRSWDFTRHFFRMIGLVFQSIASIGMPFVDCIGFMKHTKLFKNDKTRNVFLGIVISLPFLLLVTTLLSSADLLFGKMTKNVVDTIFSADIFAILFMVVFGFLACYCIICGAIGKVGLPEKKAGIKADASIAITFMTLLLLVYAVFCTIQIAYLFANGVFVLPEEFTFAEYARRGFFELLTVTVVNVGLILLCKSFFQESKVLRGIITCFTLCTYILIASATYRMILYIGAYHLTFLRLFVLLSLLIITLVLTGILIAEYKKSFPLFAYCVVVTSVCYILFSFSKPDHFIASYLMEHVDVLDKTDVAYLVYDLSLDAAPVVIPALTDENHLEAGYLNDTQNNYILENADRDLRLEYYIRIDREAKSHGWKDFNNSVSRAKKLAKEYPMN